MMRDESYEGKEELLEHQAVDHGDEIALNRAASEDFALEKVTAPSRGKKRSLVIDLVEDTEEDDEEVVSHKHELALSDTDMEPSSHNSTSANDHDVSARQRDLDLDLELEEVEAEEKLQEIKLRKIRLLRRKAAFSKQRLG